MGELVDKEEEGKKRKVHKDRKVGDREGERERGES